MASQKHNRSSFLSIYFMMCSSSFESGACSGTTSVCRRGVRCGGSTTTTVVVVWSRRSSVGWRRWGHSPMLLLMYGGFYPSGAEASERYQAVPEGAEGKAGVRVPWDFRPWEERSGH
jgi:hypothetical protein